ncbi:MAG: HAMP domain-containing histidine kinase [Nitrospinae bacterium]|nr:HAMP domain-containing histidine kinase [Nitrospinota bacterium]
MATNLSPQARGTGAGVLNINELVERAPDIIFHYQHAPIPVFSYVSAASGCVLGYSPEDHYRNPSLWLEIVEARDRDWFSTFWIQGCLKEQCETFRFVARDGRYVWLEIALSLAHDIHGDVVAMQGIARDVTGRAKMMESLMESAARAEKSVELKDKFVALLAHDLRSPIGSTLGLLRALESGWGEMTAERRAEVFKNTIGAMERMGKMVDRLLDVNRLKNGRVELDRMPAAMRALTEAGIAAHRHIAARKRITVVNEIPDTKYWYVDCQLIMEVISNLLCNALKFTPAGGEVRIRGAAPDTIEVVDNGIGMPPELTPYLFHSSSVAIRHDTEGERGHGLGLALSREIVSAHGGEIAVESSLDKGSCFAIVIPGAGLEDKGCA